MLKLGFHVSYTIVMISSLSYLSAKPLFFLPCVFRTSSLLPMLTMSFHAHTPDTTCWTRWSMPSNAGGGRSRNRGSLCLTAMLFSVKLPCKKELLMEQKTTNTKKKQQKKKPLWQNPQFILLPFSHLWFVSHRMWHFRGVHGVEIHISRAEVLCRCIIKARGSYLVCRQHKRLQWIHFCTILSKQS